MILRLNCNATNEGVKQRVRAPYFRHSLTRRAKKKKNARALPNSKWNGSLKIRISDSGRFGFLLRKRKINKDKTGQLNKDITYGNENRAIMSDKISFAEKHSELQDVNFHLFI